MSFLAPLFFLGLGAIAVPILVHLTHRPRSDTAAGTARTSAAMPTRAVTAANGDQPASISDLASGPDVLNASEENPAMARPARERCCGRIDYPSTESGDDGVRSTRSLINPRSLFNPRSLINRGA